MCCVIQVPSCFDALHGATSALMTSLAGLSCAQFSKHNLRERLPTSVLWSSDEAVQK